MGTRRTAPLAAGSLVGACLVIAAALLPTRAPSVDLSDCVTLDVSVSTEKGDLVEEMAERYNDEQRVIGDRCAQVETDKLTSGTASEELATGWDEQATGAPKPDVWLPSSSLWAQLLEHRTGEELVSGEEKSVTTSPLVIAMPEKMARALGWPEVDLGWSDLRDLANNPDWGERGHPEWGRFAMGKDNPYHSTSGLAATIATYYAATRDRGGFSEHAVSRDAEVQAFVRQVESSVAHYATDSVVFLGNAYTEDQKGSDKPYISAMITQEQMTYLYNAGAPTGDPADLNTQPPPNDPLVAIHPADGTVMIDHPYLVLAGTSGHTREVAADFRDYLLAEEQQAAFVEHGFRDSEGRTSEKVATSVGTTAQRSVDSIDLPSAKLVETMLDRWRTYRLRADVLLVLDESASMKETSDPRATESVSKLELLESAVQRGLDLLDNDDRVALWTFSTGPDYTRRMPMSPVGEVRDELSHVVRDDLRGKGNTALYNTTHAAHEMMRENLDPGRVNAIVLLTDGHDTVRGGVSRDELLDSIDAEHLDTSVRIFTIAYGRDADVEALEAIATRSKAAAYEARDPSDIDQVFVSALSNF
ncbi:substrate-binding and VWA domain-containing protein [Saccharomonospora piscinae]|uniref:substrate-binding and VWA domain-containing protein n=1 Tax=Saccharomonospora piscinae TaxID=687388 RepID=UPI000465978F|nr:substrate-binding and VWA domain-containing protein [Saccharomonospora piscinae]